MKDYYLKTRALRKELKRLTRLRFNSDFMSKEENYRVENELNYIKRKLEFYYNIKKEISNDKDKQKLFR